MSNPKAFVQECKQLCITYELLIEANECIGKQATARMFKGKSKRGGGGFCSAASVENWMETFKYVIEHPDEEDHDLYQAREIIPNENWKPFIDLVYTVIDKKTIESWGSLTTKKLTDEAKKHGITIGIANANAIKDLHERMLKMVERREKNFWSKPIEHVEQTESFQQMNIFQLKEIAKEHGINTNLKKDELIQQLQDDKKEEILLSDMTLSKLKLLAKDLGLLEYNNLQKDELIQSIIQKQKEDQEKEDRITLGGIEIISRPEDGYINATQLCKAGGKEFKSWYRNDKIKEFLEELSLKTKINIYSQKETENNLKIDTDESLSSVKNFTDDKKYLIDIKINCDNENRCTWVHPRVAIHIAQWVSPKFAVIVTGWIHKLLSTGKVCLERPLKEFSTITEMDIEAEVLEDKVKIEEFTTDSVIYVSYIGKGMIKVGFSDGKLLQRNKKHTSSESLYSQWRIIQLFKVSGRPIEKMLHDFLIPYKTEFSKQKEIYKSIKSLESFLEMIQTFLLVNDLPMKIQRLEKKVQELQLENIQLKLELELELK
jgi:hypothetical protein